MNGVYAHLLTNNSDIEDDEGLLVPEAV